MKWERLTPILSVLHALSLAEDFQHRISEACEAVVERGEGGGRESWVEALHFEGLHRRTLAIEHTQRICYGFGGTYLVEEDGVLERIREVIWAVQQPVGEDDRLAVFDAERKGYLVSRDRPCHGDVGHGSCDWEGIRGAVGGLVRGDEVSREEKVRTKRNLSRQHSGEVLKLTISYSSE